MKQERYDQLIKNINVQHGNIANALMSIAQSIDVGSVMPTMKDEAGNENVNYGPFRMFGTMFYHEPDEDLQKANIGVINRFGSLIFHAQLLYNRQHELESNLDEMCGEKDGFKNEEAKREFVNAALSQQFLLDDIVFNACSAFDYFATVAWKVIFKHWRMSIDHEKIPPNKRLPQHIDWQKITQFAKDRDKDPLFQAIAVDETIDSILQKIQQHDKLLVSRLATYRNPLAHARFDFPFDIQKPVQPGPVYVSKTYMSILGAQGAIRSKDGVLLIEAALNLIDRCGKSMMDLTSEFSKVFNIVTIWKDGFQRAGKKV